MRRVRFSSMLAAAMLLATGAEAQQRSTGGPEMWDLSNPVEPRHWFSGLRCWQEVSGAAFVHRTAFEPLGGDVSCGYAAASGYFITVYATLRRPLGAPYDAVVQQTAQEVRGRYERTETLFEGPRNLATARGPVSMNELVLNVSGFDSADRRVIRA